MLLRQENSTRCRNEFDTKKVTRSTKIFERKFGSKINLKLTYKIVIIARKKEIINIYQKIGNGIIVLVNKEWRIEFVIEKFIGNHKGF